MTLLDEIKKIESGEDAHLETQVSHLLDVLNKKPVKTAEEIWEAENQISGSNPIIDALNSTIIWDFGRIYKDGAKPALDAWEESQDYAEQHDLDRLSILCLRKRIEIRRQLTQDIGPVVVEVVSELEKYESEENIHLGNFGDLVRLIVSNKEHLSDEDLLRAAELCEERANILYDSGDYMQQRDFLSNAMTLRKEVGKTAYHEQKIINSVDEEFKGIEKDSKAGHTLYRAIQEYQDFLPSDKRDEWLKKMRERNKEGQDEMFRYELDDEARKELKELREKKVESAVERFKELSEYKGNEYALFCLLNSNFGIPPYRRPNVGNSVIAQIIGTTHEDSVGNIVGRTPSINEETEAERRRPGYGGEINRERIAVFEVLLELMDTSHLTIGDFFLFMETADLSIQEDAFLTDAIIHIFDENYTAGIHIALPTYEKIIREVMKRNDIFPGSFQGGTSSDRTLGGLLDTLGDEDVLEEDYFRMLKHVYSDRKGLDLRNQVSHGRLDHKMMCRQFGYLLLFDIARTTLRLEKSKYWAKYGAPLRF